ncbi:MAG: peroxiredoxin [Candidatus Limnocylindria bacterium]
MELKPGDRAPEFALPDETGAIRASEDFRGRRWVLYAYPKDDTPGCTTEACQFNDDLMTFDGLGVQVVGISPDDPASHRDFREKYGLRFPLLSDPTHGTLESYGAWGERPGRGPGVIRSTFLIGDDGTIGRAWYGVRPDGHAREVLAALEA